MHGEPDGEGADASADGSGDAAATEDGAGNGVPGTGGDGPTGTPGLGRRILLTVGAIVILISGGLGWFVGSNGALSDAAVLGTGLTVPVTPGALALYGVAVSTAVLAGLFGLVELASRLEGDSRAE